MRYEYKLVNMPHDAIEATVNVLGADGWQLVSFQVVDNSRNSVAVLMRVLPDEPVEAVKVKRGTRKTS